MRRALALGLSALLAAAVLSVTPAPAHAASALTVLNPDFAQTTAAGMPLHWNTWNPAGSATVSVDDTAGPSGGPAVSITSTSGATTRYALTQRVPVDAGTPRKLIVSSMVKGKGLSGGFSEVRAQIFDAAGKVLVPVQAGPYLTGTFDWKPYTTSIVLPAGAASVSIEPMVDRTPGTLSVTNVSLTVDTSSGSLTAKPTTAGTTELSWTFNDITGADHYAVYRASGSDAPAHDAGHLVATAYAPTVADDSIEAATTYTYQVDAIGADGAVLATSPLAEATTPTAFADTQQNTVLSAIQTATGAHVSWTASAAAPMSDLTLRVGRRTIAVTGNQSAADVVARAGQKLTLSSGSTVLGTTSVGASAHPRAVLTPETVSRITRQLSAGQPTITGSWNALLARVHGPDTGYTTNGSAGLYRARDAAFVYAVTGDQSYAQLAYDATMSAASFVTARDVNMGLELGRAALLLAPAYDWGYNGWTDPQRANVRHLMTRAVDLLSTYHHPALDDTVKTSNWVGVVRTTELALLLSARGDGNFGLHDKRIGFLADQVAQHLDQGYTDSGYTQEGWDYFHYTELYMFPSIYFAQGTGMNTLDSHLDRPDFANLALHVVSYRSKGDVTQFGVSYENGQVDGALPLLFPIAPKGDVPGLKSLYDTVEGVKSATKPFDGSQGLWSILYYPTNASGSPNAITDKKAHTALLDDTAGFYAFRNRYRNADDSLIVTSNRNEQHRGWSAAETFSLSWLADDTTWATLGGKHSTAPLEWSKPLVDGHLEPYADQYETVNGKGVTLASRAFTGQGGGYLHLDGSQNFGVGTADRHEVVDMATGHKADTITVIKDTFGDTESHEWDWQLRPEAGVAIAIDAHPASGDPLFTFTSPNGAVLSGFALDPTGLTARNLDGTLRLPKTGTSATFTIVLATSKAGALTTTTDARGRLVLDGRVIDAAHLSDVPATGLASASHGHGPGHGHGHGPGHGHGHGPGHGHGHAHGSEGGSVSGVIEWLTGVLSGWFGWRVR